MDGECKIPLRGFGCVLFLCGYVGLLCFLMVIRGSTVSLFFVVICVCNGGGGGVLVVIWGFPWEFGVSGGIVFVYEGVVCGDEGGGAFPCVGVVFFCGGVGGRGVVFPCEGVVILCGDVGVVFPCEGVVILCGDVGVVFPCEGVVILCGDVGVVFQCEGVVILCGMGRGG